MEPYRANSSEHRVTQSVAVAFSIVILLGSLLLLTARLGDYPLWTDEASTAITAAGVWRTGDTSAWLDDHNLLTYRDGLLLKGQKDRYTSPLQFYLAAPFVGVLGHNSLAARLPFALCGFLTVLLILRWLWHWEPPAGVWVAAAIVLLTSASFFLFNRQCRYYALSSFLLAATVYLYCRWNGGRGRLFLIGIVMSLLLAAQYLDYAAAVGCLVMDYGIWGRKRRPMRGVNWLILTGPQILTAAIICPIWNPIARAEAVVTGPSAGHAATAIGQVHEPWVRGFATVLWWNLRDLIACDFVILPLLLICPLLYFLRRDTWLLRAPMAMVMFVAGIAFFTAHPVTPRGNAEVRYLAPLLPICIVISIIAIAALQAIPRLPRAAVMCLSALAMLVGPDRSGVAVASSSADYYRELADPPQAPYRPVGEWVGANVPARATVFVTPDWCVSPMMWTAPSPTYVWQLTDVDRPDYRLLPGAYFKGTIPPDYLIAFGPYKSEIDLLRREMIARGIKYELATTVPVYWKEMFRPELIWRSSKPIVGGRDEMVYIYRRVH